MSKVLLINGSPNENGCTYTALKEIADTLLKKDVLLVVNVFKTVVVYSMTK